MFNTYSHFGTSSLQNYLMTFTSMHLTVFPLVEKFHKVKYCMRIFHGMSCKSHHDQHGIQWSILLGREPMESSKVYVVE